MSTIKVVKAKHEMTVVEIDEQVCNEDFWYFVKGTLDKRNISSFTQNTYYQDLNKNVVRICLRNTTISTANDVADEILEHIFN